MLYYKHCILGFKFVKTEYLQKNFIVIIVIIIIIVIILLLLLRWWCWWWCIWNQSHRNCGDETKVVNEIYTFAKRRLIKTLACLSLNRKNRLVSGGIKRDASDFHGTRVRFPRTFLRVVFTERSKLVERPRTGRNEPMESILPIGDCGVPGCHEIVFSPDIVCLGRPNKFFHLQSTRIFWLFR